LFSLVATTQSSVSGPLKTQANQATIAAPNAANHGENAAAESEEYNVSETINHHVGDSHSWHFAGSLILPLPIIAIVDGSLQVFSSALLDHHQVHNGLMLEHGVKEKLVSTEGKNVIDLSITKNVASLLLSAILLVAVFFTVAKGYKTNYGQAPKGIQSFFETIIVFIRDDVAKPNLGKKWKRYMPFLLTVFFFIWFNNLLGLLPGGANLTGNITLTMCLALFTFLITQFSGTSTYWGHIFWMPGVPVVLKPILAVIEFIGIFTKPFALMVRLFANIFAGHIIILSLLGLVFMFKSYAVGGIATIGASVMMILEFLVAIIQAFIFTLLSSVFIGQALEEHHHEEHAEAH
jgi:F-type H+-transporting ATPase subunit a